ncbi:MAG TPA: hypothetical protein VN809_16780 [Telmatospirillum sp.]|nr:hypothetical protein [Telmatospirillum sp.]
MTPVLTGRLILESLYTNAEQTTLAALASTLTADPAAVERLIQSLSAAKLVSRTNDCLTLSDAGRSWCAAELKPKADGAKALRAPADQTPADGGERSESPSRSLKVGTLSTGKTNRTQGVDVVHLKRRKAQLPGSVAIQKTSPEPDQSSKPSQRPRLKSAPAVETPLGGDAQDATLHSDKSDRPVAVNHDGFVTHINGRKIF